MVCVDILKVKILILLQRRTNWGVVEGNVNFMLFQNPKITLPHFFLFLDSYIRLKHIYIISNLWTHGDTIISSMSFRRYHVIVKDLGVNFRNSSLGVLVAFVDMETSFTAPLCHNKYFPRNLEKNRKEA